jgi:hypothetical protein
MKSKNSNKMIWDLHCHLSGVSGRTPDDRMAQLIEFADRMGIERICIYMGMRWSSNPRRRKILFGSHALLFYFESALLKLKESALDDATKKALPSENVSVLRAALKS